MSGGDELRSVVLGRERADEGETRESGRGSRAAWRLPGHPDEEGRGQAGREAGGVARRRARASGTRPSSCRGRRRQRRGQWAGPALAAAGLHREEAQVRFFLFLFYLNYFATVLNFTSDQYFQRAT